MTLELKQYYDPQFDNSTKPYTLFGVRKITDQTEYGQGYFAITIFERKVFITECFEYVKNSDTGEYFVKNGKWVKQDDGKGGSFNSGLGCCTTCTFR